ncbi:unnamed protein product, partial [Rotaria sp. Silwood1]
ELKYLQHYTFDISKCINLLGQGSGRGEFRRIFRNSTRGGGGGHNRLNTDSNTPDLANAADFPTLPKQ